MTDEQIPRYMAFHMAAQELAKHPECQDIVGYHSRVCSDFGIPLDSMTDDEANYLSNLVEEYYNKGA